MTVVCAEGAPRRVRVGIVAGRALGGAVERNRARRRLRHALRRVPLREGTDYVVIASPGVLAEEFEALVAALTNAVGRVEP